MSRPQESLSEYRIVSPHARTIRKIARFLGKRLDTPSLAWWDRDLPHQTVRVQGHDLCYVSAGQGPPVLLLHGFGTSMAVWSPQFRPLSRHFQVFALDLPGHGFSEKPDVEYRLGYYTDSLAGFMDAVGLSAASFVGHSMGGLLSLCLAADAPERVRRLVLVNSNSPLSRPARVMRFYEKRRRRPWFWDRVLGLLEVLIPLLPASVEARSRRKTLYNEGAVPVEWSRWMVAYRRSKGFSRMAVSTLTHWVDMLAYENKVKDIPHPVLLVCGAEDRIIPEPESRRLQQTLPHAAMEVIPACGHLATMEAPERTLRSILGFLSAASP